MVARRRTNRGGGIGERSVVKTEDEQAGCVVHGYTVEWPQSADGPGLSHV